MDLGIQDRVAIVSGGSKGIGFATAETFLRAGAKVMIAARTPATLEAAKARLEPLAPGRVDAVSADMTDEAGVADALGATVARFGPVGIAVSNVVGHVIDAKQSGPHAGFFEDVTPADFPPV